MKGTKARRLLAEKRKRLESQIAAAERVINEAPIAIKEELGVIVHQVGFDFAPKRLAMLTQDQRKLFDAFFWLTYNIALDTHELDETEMLLNPRKGRSRGSRNQNPKPVEPTIAEALKFRQTAEGQKLTLDQLSQNFNSGRNRTQWTRWKYRFKKAQQKQRG